MMKLNEFEYVGLSDGSYKITGYDGDKENIEIPEGVTVIATDAFKDGWLHTLKLPSTLKRIDDDAFMDCTILREVDFSACASLESIGANAFAGCEQIKSAILPESLKKLGYGAFSYCMSLSEVYLPAGITDMDWDIFEGCDSLKTITVSGNIPASWGDRWNGSGAKAISQRSAAQSSHTPTKVKEAPRPDPKPAIKEKKAGGKMTPDELRECLDRVGNRIENLRKYAAEAVKKAAEAAPRTAPVPSESAPAPTARPAPTAPTGEEYTPLSKFVTEPYDGGLKIVKCLDSELTELILPPEIVMIDHKAFYLHHNLRRFKAGRTLKIIFNYAFGSCPVLSEAEYSIHTSVCEGAFSGCPLTKATLTPIVYDGAFRATRVREVEFKGLDWGEVKEIPNSVLSHSDLRSVDLPESVTSIGYSAFAFCEELTKVSYRGNINYMAAGVFESCTKLEEFTMPSDVSGVPARAFAFCSGLKRIKITDRAGEIGKMAFYRCDSLRELHIPRHIYRIGEAAVMSSSLERVIFEGRTLAEVKKIFGFSWLVMSSPKVDIVCSDTTYRKERFLQ